MNIIAIGGGSVALGETEAIDRELVSLSGKRNPVALFIPTASMDDDEYIGDFIRTYSRFGCQVDVLRLHSNEDPAKIVGADLVYVGGGNTKMMLEVWREREVDKILRTHVDQGKPIGGLSAGAICWFRVGNSDWPQYEGIPDLNTARLDCLGWINLAACPHTKREEFRLAEFREMMRTEQGPGIGLDDGCAIQVRSGEYRILASMPDSVAHRIEWVDGTLVESTLLPCNEFAPLGNLLSASVAE